MRITHSSTAGTTQRRGTAAAAAPSSRLTRLALAIAVALLAAAFAAFGALGAPPANAHSQLVSSSPAADESLDAAPTEVTLTFNEDLIDYGGAIEVVDTDETNWADGEPAFEGPNVSVALAADMPAGSYEVRWQVVSADGHPVSGVIPFTVDAAAETPVATSDAAGTGAEGAGGLGGGSATPAATSGLSGENAPGNEAASEADGLSPWVIVLIAVAVLVVAALLVFALRRPRTGNASPATGEGADTGRSAGE